MIDLKLLWDLIQALQRTQMIQVLGWKIRFKTKREAVERKDQTAGKS